MFSFWCDEIYSTVPKRDSQRWISVTEEATLEPARFLDRTTGQKRAFALDALRGFAILTMALSGYIPWGVLPSWMYHAQVPPPAHKFNPTIPGITWVDLVFPFFLFAMGAAIPRARADPFRLPSLTPAILRGRFRSCRLL